MNPEKSNVCTQTDTAVAPDFEELYLEYKNAVFGYACYLTRNKGEAEDLFQDTWLRVVKHLPKTAEKRSLKSWIFTIVTNLYRDSLRKKKVRRLFLIQNKLDLRKKHSKILEARISPHESKLDNFDLQMNISLAIDSLPERQRRVFILKEVAGFKQEEVGDILSIPQGTVKSLMHRAVKKLQQELSDYNPKFIQERGQNAM